MLQKKIKTITFLEKELELLLLALETSDKKLIDHSFILLKTKFQEKLYETQREDSQKEF